MSPGEKIQRKAMTNHLRWRFENDDDHKIQKHLKSEMTGVVGSTEAEMDGRGGGDNGSATSTAKGTSSRQDGAQLIVHN